MRTVHSFKTMFRMAGQGLVLAFLCLSQIHAAALSNLIVDQFGWRTASAKVAILAAPQTGVGSPSSFTPGASFQVLNASTSAVVFTGTPTSWNGGATQSESGDLGWWADFSALTTPGTYVVSVPGGSNPGAVSYPFSIGDPVYQGVLQAAVKMYFYQRCGEDIDAAHGGLWTHAACHQQEAAADLYDGSDQGQPVDIRGGWHDAGDYRKYVSFVFPTLWRLMKAYEWYPCAFGDATGIPESGNGVPDILDEVKWELDWLLRMQAPSGALYSGAFVVGSGTNGGDGDPSTENTVYYHANISSGATSTGAMAFAMASRIFAPYAAAYPGYSATLLTAAQNAWAWLQANPSNVTYNATNFNNANANVSADEDFRRRVTAAAELFRTTGNAAYKAYVDANYNSSAGSDDGGTYHPILNNSFWPSAADSLEIGLVEYAGTPGATAATVNAIITALTNGADSYITGEATADLYRAYMWDGYYGWGSNSGKGLWGDIGVWASQLGCGTATNQAAYRAGSEEYLHYIHGRNPLNWVYLTNMGSGGANLGASQSIDSIYHGWFFTGTQYDGLVPGAIGPAPGILSGGPDQSFAPDPSYVGTISPPQNEPMMKAYKNWDASWPQDSWEVTEPDLGYQAPYVLLLAASVPCAGPAPTPTRSFTLTPYAGTPTSTLTVTPSPSLTATQTPVCQTLLNSCQSLAVNGTWAGGDAVRSIVAAGSAPAGAVTLGSNCLAADITVSASWQDSFANLGGFSPAVWTPYAQLSADVYIPASVVGSTYTQLELYGDCAGCGTGIWYQPIAGNVPAVVAGEQTVTWTIDYAAGTIPAGSAISNIYFILNTSAATALGTVYFDNLRLIGPCGAGSPTPTASATRSAGATGTASASPSPTPGGTRTASPSLTPSQSPTASPSTSPSPSMTLSPTPSMTPSPTPSVSPSPAPSATLTPYAGTPTCTWSASPTPSAGATRSASPSLSASPSGSVTSSVSASPSATPSPGGAATHPPFSATVAGSGPLGVQRAVPEPNPDPRWLALLMGGPADRAEVRIYTQAFIVAGVVPVGPLAAGWNRLDLGSWGAGLPSGTYFLEVRAWRGAAVSRSTVVKTVLLR